MLFFLPLQVHLKTSHANLEVVVSYSLLEKLLHLTDVNFFLLLEVFKSLLLHFYCLHKSVDVIVFVFKIVLIVLLHFIDVGLLGLPIFNHKLLLELQEYSIVSVLELLNVLAFNGKLDLLPDDTKIRAHSDAAFNLFKLLIVLIMHGFSSSCFH